MSEPKTLPVWLMSISTFQADVLIGILSNHLEAKPEMTILDFITEMKPHIEKIK